MVLKKLIFNFEELGKEHKSLVGKKCANLGEMTRMGVPIPPGFAISIAAYQKFAEETGASKQISQYTSSLGELKGKNIAFFDKLSRTIRGIIEDKEIPAELSKLIASYYEKLGKSVGINDVPVSARSAGAKSRPGMFESYLNIIGIEDLMDKVKKVWSSAYTTRAIALRVNKDIPVMADELGIAVNKMINSRSAGVAFTIDPVTGDDSRIMIDANWGLGEGVVSGAENVDRFVIDKESLNILDTSIGNKTKQVTNKKKGTKWNDVPRDKREVACISNDEITAISKLALKLEKGMGRPQDIEWAIDADLTSPDNIFILQTRPAKAAVKNADSVTDRMLDLMSKRFYRPDNKNHSA